MIITAYSDKPNYLNAVADIEAQFYKLKPKMIIYFASSFYPPQKLAVKINETYPNITTIGCTTAGEVCNQKTLEQSIVAMALDETVIGDFFVKIWEDLSNMTALDSIFEEFSTSFKEPVITMSPKEYFGMVLIDGLSSKEESTIQEIDKRTNIPFIGGSAGDDLRFDKTYVFYNDQAYSNAALLLISKPKVSFGFIKTQSFDILPDTLICTRVDVNKRKVYEINNQPATTEYARILGVKPSKLEEYFMTYPFGEIINGEPFVKSPQKIEGTSIKFYSAVLPDISYHILKSFSIIADTKINIAEKVMNFGEITGLINFNCILRILELKNNDQLKAYGEIFENIPSIGFSTYGESFSSFVNQTSVMLLFGH